MTYTRKQKGGNFEELNVRQIILTKPIMNTLESEMSNTSFLSQFTKQKGKEQGFKLHKMNTIKKAKFNSLPPITVKKTPYGKNINGKRKRLYELIDGRHRLTRAISLGRKTIKANIQ